MEERLPWSEPHSWVGADTGLGLPQVGHWILEGMGRLGAGGCRNHSSEGPSGQSESRLSEATGSRFSKLSGLLWHPEPVPFTAGDSYSGVCPAQEGAKLSIF